MEEKRVVVYVLVIFLLVFGLFFVGNDAFSKFTGYVISDQLSECNIADFNEDGEVDFNDKVIFNMLYEEHVDKTDYCGRVDVNGDGTVNVVDSNRFSEIFDESYGVYESPCSYKILDCEVREVGLDGETDIERFVEEQVDVVEEVPISYNTTYVFVGVVLILIILVIIMYKKNIKKK